MTTIPLQGHHCVLPSAFTSPTCLQFFLRVYSTLPCLSGKAAYALSPAGTRRCSWIWQHLRHSINSHSGCNRGCSHSICRASHHVDGPPGGCPAPCMYILSLTLLIGNRVNWSVNCHLLANHTHHISVQLQEQSANYRPCSPLAILQKALPLLLCKCRLCRWIALLRTWLSYWPWTGY